MSRAHVDRIDPRAVVRAHEQASGRFDAHAVVHARAREELLSRLALIGFEPTSVLDLGAATGHGARGLRERWPRARVLALDTAPGMVAAMAARQGWRRRFDRLRADALQLPIRDGALDLVYSNLLLPSCPDLRRQFGEIRRVLAPRGYFTFSTLGPDTLRELRAAFAAVDEAAHVHPFLDMHEVGDALAQAGFADPVMDVERVTVTYATIDGLVADLRGSGARNALADRRRGLGGRLRAERLRAAYERFRDADGRLPATCEIIYGQAWCPGGSPPVRGRRGETVVPLEALRRR